jgi:hypothetical protein
MAKEPFEVVLGADGVLEIRGMFEEKTSEQLAEQKRISTQCGHVKRRLLRNERLTGKVLEFALEVLGGGSCSMAKPSGEIARKLEAGERLTDYETHLMVDVVLLQKRLGS